MAAEQQFEILDSIVWAVIIEYTQLGSGLETLSAFDVARGGVTGVSSIIAASTETPIPRKYFSR
ncbi:hypothetical protein [Rhodococcus globerulus]|uniref:Uncharacterized protein n=1 Tax=Rhodococcus globerulus TaxID=33008 RepID=A0ABU4C5Q2_RHOGO|nr:hypothetical protein [Rhodococcus globerulus]MDV6271523.1 hypothetical protein [Rhodococcus globerulus]